MIFGRQNFTDSKTDIESRGSCRSIQSRKMSWSLQSIGLRYASKEDEIPFREHVRFFAHQNILLASHLLLAASVVAFLVLLFTPGDPNGIFGFHSKSLRFVLIFVGTGLLLRVLHRMKRPGQISEHIIPGSIFLMTVYFVLMNPFRRSRFGYADKVEADSPIYFARCPLEQAEDAQDTFRLLVATILDGGLSKCSMTSLRTDIFCRPAMLMIFGASIIFSAQDSNVV